MTGLENAFHKILRIHRADQHTILTLWDEIRTMHSTGRRHYHTLEHLEYIHQQLQRAESSIHDHEPLVIATVYHDAIQNMVRKDDEERSAALMRKRLDPLGISTATLDRAADHILATRSHRSSDDPDTDLFTDADLSILGADREAYSRYADLVRKEYALIPDLIYGPGRRKVLEQFLALPEIFKTAPFSHLQGMARSNIQWELDRL